jgi:hypothetical protein
MTITQSGSIGPKGISMRFGTTLKLVLCASLAVTCVTGLVAQQVRFFPDFSSVAFLSMNVAHQASYNGQYVLRLTDGYSGVGAPHAEAGTAWFQIPQIVTAGFTSYFRFQVHNATCCNPGDGLAFVIQNTLSADPTYGATGYGVTARGTSNGGLGYAGLPNSVAIEFDTHFDNWDYTGGGNHVALQGCGTNTNTPVHDPTGTYTIGRNNNVKTCLIGSTLNTAIPTLGASCGVSSCADGNPHDVVVEYAQVSGVWTLMVYIDPQFIPGTHTPVPGSYAAINVPYTIDGAVNPSTGLSLRVDSKGKKTSAYIGFTGSQNLTPQQQDILAWEFTPHAPTQVTQTIQNGCDPNDPTCVPTTFTFGGHVDKVTYFPGFVNSNGIKMTVVATPISRSQFSQTRLQGTPFFFEQCVVYQGTGGNCIVYSVTCTDSNNNPIACPSSVQGTCNNIGDPGCINFSTSYYTTDGVTPQNADYLKSDPIGTNNWVSIFQSFQSGTFDPRTSGSGGTPSDFVATFFVGTHP